MCNTRALVYAGTRKLPDSGSVYFIRSVSQFVFNI